MTTSKRIQYPHLLFYIIMIFFYSFEFSSLFFSLSSILFFSDVSTMIRNKCIYLRQKFEETFSYYPADRMIITDGSKSDDSIGYSFYSSVLKLKMRLPCQIPVFTAELVAISSVLKFIEAIEDEDQFVVRSDSLSGIMAIHGMDIKHPYILVCIPGYICDPCYKAGMHGYPRHYPESGRSGTFAGAPALVKCFLSSPDIGLQEKMKNRCKRSLQRTSKRSTTAMKVPLKLLHVAEFAY